MGTKKPTIHLNGTSREALRAGYEHAIASVQRARGVLCECIPNARDYYPQGDGAFEEAMDQHRMRDAALEVIIIELYEILTAVESD